MEWRGTSLRHQIPAGCRRAPARQRLTLRDAGFEIEVEGLAMVGADQALPLMPVVGSE